MRIDGSALKCLASATARPGKEEAPAVLSRVRDVVPASDAPLVHRLITALSRQRGAFEPEYSVERLGKDLGDVCFAIIGEVSEDRGASWRAAGYALFFETYSSWTGKALYLEDIYVEDGVRGTGVGFKLLKHCAERAVGAAYERMQCMFQSKSRCSLLVLAILPFTISPWYFNQSLTMKTLRCDLFLAHRLYFCAPKGPFSIKTPTHSTGSNPQGLQSCRNGS